MEITLLNAIELLAGFQAFLFAFYLIFKKEGKKLSNYFIAVFMMLLAYNVLDYFAKLIFNQLSENITTVLQLFIYLAAPALYFHIKTSLYSNFTLKRKDFWHTLPFFMLLGVVIYLIIVEITSGGISQHTERIVGIIFYAVLYLQTYSYLYFSYGLLRKHKGVFYENYSTTNTKRYTYIANLIIFIAVLYSLSIINIVTRWVYDFESFSFISYVVISNVLMLFCWLIILGLRSPELFIDETKAQPSVKKLLKPNAGNSAIKSKPESNEMIKRLYQYMNDEEPFLNASLTLYDLAKDTGISSRELSILINHTLNKHFFDFINEYRIKKAMDLIQDSNDEKLTILEILYQVGFNSKSSFNTAFKKHTGITPTEFKKNTSLRVA